MITYVNASAADLDDAERWAGRCPICENPGIEGDGITIEGPYAFQEVACTNCNSDWLERYVLERRQEINADPIHEEFGPAMDELGAEGIPFSVDHTGGGIHVLYVRGNVQIGNVLIPLDQIEVIVPEYNAPGVFHTEHPQIGVTRDEDYPDDLRWFVVAYDYPEDDELHWFRRGVSTRDLANVVRDAARTLEQRLSRMSEDQAKAWAQEKAGWWPEEWEPTTVLLVHRGWVLHSRASGVLHYDRDLNGGHHSMRYALLELATVTNPDDSWWLLYWDDVVANSWTEWYSNRHQADAALGRLITAVTLDVTLDEIAWAPVYEAWFDESRLIPPIRKSAQQDA